LQGNGNIIGREYDAAFAAGQAVHRARVIPKALLSLGGAVGTLCVMLAIINHQPAVAAGVVVVAVFGVGGFTEKFKEKGRLFGFLNLQKRSWGYAAMGSLLPLAAYLEADVWPSLRAASWTHRLTHVLHIPDNWPQTWGFWVLVAVVVLAYGIGFRKGEAKNYRDHLRFNSWGKLVHDFVAVTVSFVPVICGILMLLFTDWPGVSLAEPALVAACLLIWFVAGVVFDLRRLDGKGRFPIRREDIHVQGTPAGPAHMPEISPVLSPLEFRERLRYERRYGRGHPEPG